MALCDRYRPWFLGDALTQQRPRPSARKADGTRYDQAYFDKWYRHPRHRVKSPAELARQAQFVLASAEFLLGRAVRTVLDVGCGEGQWRAALRRHRPRLAYTGVDPSRYAIARYGARRHLLRGSIDALDQLPLDAAYDLVICCGMLNYLHAPVLRQGLRQVAARTGGLAYLELFTREDHFEGDTDWPAPRGAAWYRQQMTRAGFHSIGMQCYITDRSRDRVSALEVKA